MGTTIPVICDNPSCGTLWFSQSIFGIGPGATINSTGNRAGPCPVCKGMGHIPDGIYTHTSATLFNTAELHLVNQAFKALWEKAKAGATSDQIQKEITESYPFLRGLAKFLPKNATELATYLALLGSVFLYFSQAQPQETTPSIHVEVNVSQAIEQISVDVKEENKDKNKAE